MAGLTWYFIIPNLFPKKFSVQQYNQKVYMYCMKFSGWERRNVTVYGYLDNVQRKFIQVVDNEKDIEKGDIGNIGRATIQYDNLSSGDQEAVYSKLIKITKKPTSERTISIKGVVRRGDCAYIMGKSRNSTYLELQSIKDIN